MSDKLLTVGMAVYGEFPNTWFTLETLRSYHRSEIDEIIVVDNHPQGCSRTAAKTLAVGGRYIHRPDLSGTSKSRQHIFELSQSRYTMVIDAHVVLAPGSLSKTREFLKSRAINDSDLFHGPVLLDNGEVMATQWVDNFCGGLWGEWFCSVDLLSSDRPIPISSMGLGLFLMETKSFPGFNPGFTQFGGEESYLHEKVRQRGGKCWCLPWLRWGHQWRESNNVGGNIAPYPFDDKFHIRNMVLGHWELGVDPELIWNHFKKKVSRNDFDSFLVDAKSQGRFGWGVPRRPIPGGDVVGIWYTDNSAPTSLLLDSLRTVKIAADRAGVKVLTSVWNSIPGNPFPEVTYGGEKKCHHSTIAQQILDLLDRVGSDDPYGVCLLEHDVLYPRDYFERFRRAWVEKPTAKVISHLNYEGLNHTGWQSVRERHEPLHQLGIQFDYAKQNFFRALKEASRPKPDDWAYLEPDSEVVGTTIISKRSNWVRILWDPTVQPSVHVNRKTGRFTTHGDVCYLPVADRKVHPFWGDFRYYWKSEYGSSAEGGGIMNQNNCNCGSELVTSVTSSDPQLQNSGRVQVHTGVNFPYPTAAAWYDAVRYMPSGLVEALPVIREYAARVNTVAEMSIRPTVARAALAAGLEVGIKDSYFDEKTQDSPKEREYRGYSTGRRQDWVALDRLLDGSRGVLFRPTLWGSPDDMTLGECDLLLWDRQADQCYGDLTAFAPVVSSYLVVFGTAIHGDVESGLVRFLRENNEWTCIYHDRYITSTEKFKVGVALLSRRAEDKKEEPGLFTKARNYATAKVKYMAAGRPQVNEKVYNLRMAECTLCEWRIGETCGACGCPVEYKGTHATEDCGLVKLGLPPKWIATVKSEDLL